jgi:hypothetical protein
MGRHSAEDRRDTSIIGERDRTREALANYNNNHRNPRRQAATKSIAATV